jgi:hypothetical protein
MSSAWVLSLVSALLGANPFLEEGKQFYRDMFYPQAADRLRVAVDAPNITREERREAVDLLARSLAALGHLDEAEHEYARLLEKDSNAPAPAHAAPKIRQAFLKAKERLYPHDFVQLTLVAVTPASIEINMVDPWQAVHDIDVFQARPGEPFAQLEVSVDGTGRVTGRLDTRRQPVRYYARAVGVEGRVLASLGTEKTPLSYGTAPEVRVDPGPEAGGLVASPGAGASTRAGWPVWTLAGSATVAAVASGGLAAWSSSDYQSAATTPVGTTRKSLDDSSRSKAIGAYVAGGVALAAALGAVLVWKWP